MESREDCSYGWNAKGQRFYALKSGIRQGRVNMIAAYCNGQLLAPFTVEGSCNRTVFETWLKTCLIPTLKRSQFFREKFVKNLRLATEKFYWKDVFWSGSYFVSSCAGGKGIYASQIYSTSGCYEVQ